MGTGRNGYSLDELSPAEKQMLVLCCAGLTDKEIAGKMGMKPRTVSSYIDGLKKKLHAKNKTELASISREMGIDPPSDDS